jgi:hypothetical protein
MEMGKTELFERAVSRGSRYDPRRAIMGVSESLLAMQKVCRRCEQLVDNAGHLPQTQTLYQWCWRITNGMSREWAMQPDNVYAKGFPAKRRENWRMNR